MRTTWYGTEDANRWRFNEVEIGHYFEVVTNNEEGYASLNGQNAYNGGFIFADDATDAAAGEVPGYTSQVSVEDNVITVTYERDFTYDYAQRLNAALEEINNNATLLPALYSEEAATDALNAIETITYENNEASVSQAINELDAIMDTFRNSTVGRQFAFLSNSRGTDYYLTANYEAGSTNEQNYITATTDMKPSSVFVIDSYDNENNSYTVKNVFTEGYLPKLNNIPFNTKFGTSSEEEAGHYTITVQNEEVNLVFLQNTESPVANDRGGIHLDDRLDIVVWGNTGNGSRWILIPVSDEEYADLVNFDVTISQVGYTTLYCDYALEVPEGVKAYAVTFNEETGNLTPAELTEGEIPANTGVVVKGDASTTAQFTRVATTEVSANSDLQGVCQTTEASTVGDNIYVLSATKVSEGVYGNVGFYKFVGANLAAYKAYFIPSNGAEVRSFALDFGTEGIIDITTGERVEAGFDLQGRPVSKNAKSGLYIIGGKKMMKK